MHTLSCWAILPPCILIFSPIGLLPTPACGALTNETGDWSLTVTPSVVRPEVKLFPGRLRRPTFSVSAVLFWLDKVWFCLCLEPL